MGRFLVDKQIDRGYNLAIIMDKLAITAKRRQRFFLGEIVRYEAKSQT